jgi:RimJ/RimL family protein N-acetyltransferase
MPTHPPPPRPSPLQGTLVRLRARELSDVRRANELFNDPDVLWGLLMTFPIPTAATREWFEGTRDDPNGERFAIETLAGEFIGICSVEDIAARSRSAEVGIWIGKPFWGQGYGTDAMRVLARFAFSTMNLQRLSLHVYATNAKAIRAYEKVGFVVEGRLRRDQFLDGGYVDTISMGLLAEELVRD